MSDDLVHILDSYRLKILCGSQTLGPGGALAIGAGGLVDSATCPACVELAATWEPPAPRAPAPPRQLREGDTLGRAGRLDGDKPVKVSRARDMTAEDLRRVSLDGGAESGDPSLEIVERPPLVDEATGEILPVVGWQEGDDSRGLQHLDGKSEPRASREVEELEARWRDSVFTFDRLAMNADLRAARKAKPLHEQLRDLEHEFVKLQTQQARRIAENDAAARPGAAGGDSTPQGDEYAVAFLDSRGVNSRFVQIRWHIDALWEAIDAHHGRGVNDYSMMDKAEKDAILTGPQLRGCTPEEIHALHPALGAAVTIERVRRGAGQDRLGLPREPREAVVRTKWTDEDDRLVLHSTVPDSELTTRLGRTADAIRLRRKRLNEKAAA